MGLTLPPALSAGLGFLGKGIHHLQLEQGYAMLSFWHMACLFVFQVLSGASFLLARQYGMSPFGACPSSTYYLCCCCKAVGPLDPNHPKILLWLLNTRPSILISACLTTILIAGSCWQDNYDNVHQIVPNRRNLATSGSAWDASSCSNTVCDSLSNLDLMENKRCNEEALREQTPFGDTLVQP